MQRRLSIWAPLPLDVHLRRRRRPLPFPLEEPGCRLMAWARHGIWHGARHLGLGRGDAVLVPAYHHGSEVEALLQAGLECRFYDATDDLEPDAAELERLLDGSVRALYVTHFLGFPADAARWRQWTGERGLLLIEDAAQAWLATRDGVPVGAHGDLAVFCLYKTFGLGEGAAVLASSAVADVPLDRRFGSRELVRRHGMWLAARSAIVYAASRPFRRPHPYDPVRDFDLRHPHVGPWRYTPFVLARIADESAAARRRANYAALLDALRPLVPSPFDVLPSGASPFVLPISVMDADSVADRLDSAGIGHLRLWTVPHPSLPAERFPGAAERRAGTLGLPVHQELRRRDVGYIASAAAAACIPAMVSARA